MPDLIKKNKRFIFIALGLLLFLPPLSAIPQTAGEVNMCGAVCPRMFFIIPAKGIWSGFANSISSAWFGVRLVSAILAVTVFFGRLWCSHLCPIGGAAEVVSKGLPEKLKIDFSFMNAPAFRYGYFFIYIAGAVIGIGSIACKLCNFRVLPFLIGSPFVPAYQTYLLTTMGIAGLFTAGLTGFFARGGRAYCNLLCPVGALDSLANYFGAKLGFTKRMRTDISRCSGCGRCVDSCMVWAIKIDENQKAKRGYASCMSCRECEKACPEGAISYGKN